jgi:tRNA pseudouridine38-40 synthase
MVKAGRGKMDVEAFQSVLLAQDSSEADFSAPAQGLFLEDVIFPNALSAILR